jgi:hypothetical protein
VITHAIGFGLCVVAALIAQIGTHALAQNATPFDGAWTVTLDCPTHKEGDDFAKAYREVFPAEVKAGALRGLLGAEGQPGCMLLTGKIARDGKANLKLDGMVSNERYAINDAPRGKPYTYKVRAQFEPTKGTGERLGQRKCDFTFVKG